MKKHNVALLASLLVAVFLSGCIKFPERIGRGAATGVIIKSFAPDISEIYSGDAVYFTITVENVGGEDATGITAKLYGLGTDWGGPDWETPANRLKSIPDLERSQPEFKVPGGIGDATWDVTAPSGLRVDNTYTANVRLYYAYATSGVGNIKIYNNEYLRSNPTEAESIMRSPGVESFTVTNAPISVELAGLARPLVYRGDGTQEATVTFLLENTGQGKPYLATEADMEVRVESLTINNAACLNTIDTTPRLPRTGRKSIPCRFELPAVDAFTTIPIEIELSYNYFLDDATTIKVLRSLFVGGTTAPTLPPP